ncbi:MAG: threonylcarbamoyl-AMP synthase [Clostridiales bacterium]|jgi:L-threonylcarbamoyladenylate synthase|nr:threonylcarbamoyl-AMP synthase [Clostridiales bacterium]
MLRRGGVITHAARVISEGGLVAFPTETVYGLGANALNAEAVAKLYAVKGRPGDNPLILHVRNLGGAIALAGDFPEHARKLAREYWPGPLTLVVNKSPALPAWVGGHPCFTARTVALRVPSHPSALALIEAAGVPIAAPSANKSGAPSPTDASHVEADLGGAVDYILDGGEISVGLESTVLDVTGGGAVILRPGAVTAEMLSAVLGTPVREAALVSGESPRSPGTKYRHYAPRAEMTVVCGNPEACAAYIAGKLSAESRPGGILATAQTEKYYKNYFKDRIHFYTLPEAGDSASGGLQPGEIAALAAGDRADPQTVARNLYACLRRFDSLGAEVIYAEGVGESGLGRAVMDRMVKAAGGNVVFV